MLETVNKKHLACILFAVSFFLFIRTIHYEAVWDDARVHFNTANQRKMEKDVSVFWKDHSGMYIPLTYTTWAIIKKVFSPNHFEPAPFHLLNVLTHSINGVLLFYLLLLFFKNKSTAFLGSLLFLIHPLQVESVVWISEFRGLYSTFFCLISLLFFFIMLEKHKIKNQSAVLFSKGYWFAFAFYILALLAKPSGIVLPLIILMLSWRYYKEKLIHIVKSLSIWLLPAVLVIFLLIVKNPESSSSIAQRFLISGFTLFFYIQKIILPYPLAACYGYTTEVVMEHALSYVSLILCILVFIILIMKRNKFPDLFTAFMIIFICVLPVLGLIPFAYQAHSIVADRYAYMSLIGVAFLIPGIEKFIVNKTISKSLSIIFSVLLFFFTIKQTSTWKDEFTLWDHTLKYYDNSSIVYYNRGVQYSLKGNFTDAIADYSRALEIQPTNRNALFNRANAYENKNDLTAAFKDYTAYIKMDPTDGSVYYKRCVLFYKSGKLDEALDDLQRAEELRFPVDPRFKEMVLKAKFSEDFNQSK